MKRLIIVLSATAICLQLYAQQDSAKPPEFGWKHSLVSGLTVSQVAYTDWVQGGDNALAYTISADGKSVDDELQVNWATGYKFAFGQARLGNQGVKKTDDLIDISSVLTYKIGTYINPYAAASIKTQFANGFSYDAANNATQLSKFFDPAYLTQSVGVGYQPVKEVKTRFGFGLREIVTDQYNQYADDPTTASIEKVSVEGGVESVTNVDWKIDEDILLTSQLEFFAPVKSASQLVSRNTTALTMKVNKYVTTILSLQVINEPKASPRTQMRESIAIGISYTVF